jgi:hypothetical protein
VCRLDDQVLKASPRALVKLAALLDSTPLLDSRTTRRMACMSTAACSTQGSWLTYPNPDEVTGTSFSSALDQLGQLLPCVEHAGLHRGGDYAAAFVTIDSVAQAGRK